MAIEADPSAPMRLYYFSFADGSRPHGQQFLGGLFIRAKSFSGALVASHLAGLNPGGEVQSVELLGEVAAKIDPAWIGRLLSRAELEKMDQLEGQAS
jgi:hypothetical protein